MNRLATVDLNLLVTLVAFAQHGSVAGAARVLSRSQPAISARLHQLEDDLGVALFERHGRRLHLTPVGRGVHNDARTLLEGAQALLDRARSPVGAPGGLLRMGVLPTVGLHIVAPHLPAWVQALPAAEFHLVYGLADGHIEALAEGALDVVVSVGDPPRGSGVEVTILGKVSPVLVLPAARSDDVPDPVDLRAVERPYLAFGHVGDAFFDEVWRFVESEGIASRVRLVVPNIQTLKALVAGGAGMSILPDYTVVEPALATRRVRGLDATQSLWLATRRSASAIPLVAWVSRALREAAQPSTTGHR